MWTGEQGCGPGGKRLLLIPGPGCASRPSRPVKPAQREERWKGEAEVRKNLVSFSESSEHSFQLGRDEHREERMSISSLLLS